MPPNYALQCDVSAFGGAAPELGRWARHNTMKLPVGILMAAVLTVAQAAPPIPDKDEALKAAQYVGQLFTWRQLPGIWLQKCAGLDPAGRQERRRIYDKWAVGNKNEIEHIDVITPKFALYALPDTYAANGGESFRASFTERLVHQFESKDAVEKTEMCKHFAELPLFNEPTYVRKGMHSFVENWLATQSAIHQSRAQQRAPDDRPASRSGG